MIKEPLKAPFLLEIMRLIKIINAPSQTFSMVLNQKRCSFAFKYNETNDRWSFDLSIDDRPSLHGMRVTLDKDLLEHYQFGIGKLFAVDYSELGNKPGREELHDGTVRLFHVTEEEFNDAAL